MGVRALQSKHRPALDSKPGSVTATKKKGKNVRGKRLMVRVRSTRRVFGGVKKRQHHTLPPTMGMV